MKRTTILMAAFLCLFSLTESPAQNTYMEHFPDLLEAGTLDETHVK